ncbi:MAG: hypothetical protein RLY70_1201 [Planctomycetota bacterium]
MTSRSARWGSRPGFKFAALLMAILAVVTVAATVAQQPPRFDRQQAWNKVRDAMNKGLPKTAIEELKPIVAAALREKRYAEAIKAIGQTIAYEGMIEGGKAEEKVTRMRAEIAKAPAEMKPVMEAILANWFWQYYQQNRWRFLQRARTESAPSEDFTTWDLPRLLREIDGQFSKALGHAELLKKTPIAAYDDLLEKGTASDAHRPTLYDFVAFNALEFYASGEQASTGAEDVFEVTADSPALSAMADFVAWEPMVPADDESLKPRAIRLYQELIRFHLRDSDRTALLDADLARLVYCHSIAVGEEKDSRYAAALKRVAEAEPQHPLSSLALAHLATQHHSDGDWVEARRIAQEGKRRFPESVGGVRCHNLLQQIEARDLQISTERVWTAPPPSIRVSYRNLSQVHFRVVAWDVDEFLMSSRYSPSQLDLPERNALLAKAPALAWSAPLKPTEDFQMRTVELPANLDLKPGSYFLIASADPKFGQANNLISFSEFWVSDLAVVVRNFHGSGFLEGFVLDARTGEPIANATVRTWQFRGRAPRLVGMPRTTDANGLFRLDDVVNSNALIDVKVGARRLVTGQSYGAYAQPAFQEPLVRTFFFTDRAIYRPGQTIQYKGVSVFADQQKDMYASYAKQSLTVALVDVNGKEVERRVHTTNAFGSISGSFTAPRDRLLGAMRITVVEGRAAGDAIVRVEEYKRPKFQVSLDAPVEPARLAREVTLKGKATAYTGAAIDNAKVKWRVVRRVRYPDWWIWRCWWMPPQPDQSQEIAHGTAVTDVGGSFTIQFTAKPDLSVDEDSEPRFTFAVSADVTDGAGETRSADRQVTVGYTALAASLAADEWQQTDRPVAIRVRAESLDGEGRVAEGVLKVYRVEQPAEVTRASLFDFQPPTPFPRPVRGLGRGGAGRSVGGPGGAGKGAAGKGAAGKGGAAAIAGQDREAPPTDPSRPESWPLGPMVHEQGVTTAAAGSAEASVKLAEGFYRAKYEARDAFGKLVTAELPFRVLAPTADKLGLKVPDLFAAPKWTVEPGEEFSAVWGTGYNSGRAYVEFEHRGQVVERFWTPAGKTQIALKRAVTEAMRGGFTIRVTHVQENRAYLHSRQVEVPWSNKRLAVRWERFVSKLEPNQKVTWTAVVTGSDAKKAAAELVAGLYDASLDVFAPHSWIDSFGVFRVDHSNVHSDFDNRATMLQYLLGQWQLDFRGESLRYRAFPSELIGAFMPQMLRSRMMRGMAPGAANGMLMEADAMPMAAAMAPMEARGGGGMGGGASVDKRRALASGMETFAAKASADRAEQAADGEAGPGGGPSAAGPDLGKVAARKNLQETAFFFPTLVSNSDGEARIEFTIPEALTEWKFLGFAHDQALRSGLLTDKAVTAKDLMVQPNPPRFAREGDMLEFTVKVSNQSAVRQTGKARLSLADARTGASVDAAFGNPSAELEFDVPSKESRTLAWRLTVPDDASFVTYKVVGATSRVSDGEEGMLPVLSRRIMVTESLPLPIRGKQTKEFVFDRLVKSGQSDTLKHKTLSVQMVSNPSWYAVMALPYLMEFPHECTEQSFNRLYANALARHIAASDPKIRRVFDQWKGTPALDSPLTKNQDLKAVMLEETPWVRDAEAESQARRNVGILFDDNRLNDETQRLMAKLAESQLEDGAWPWFPGGRGNDYITLYITTGFGRLRHLGVKLDMAPAIRSLDRLDNWADQSYRDIVRLSKDKNANHLSTTIALYLYCRGFFLEDKPIAPEKKEALDYWLGQAKTHWLALGERQSQAHLALALRRFGDPVSAKGIGRSMEERSVSSEEMGKFWRDTEVSWWWYRAPIETQAMMIELFDEVMGDKQAVEDCKVWLLKQKQTQDWKTTKATADAVYALLLRGTDNLASDALVEVSLGGKPIRPEQVEAGTGFFEERRTGGDIKPELGRVTVRKTDDGVAWGSVHWQYLEDMSKVTPYDGTPLKLRKTLFVKQLSKKGPTLAPVVDGAVTVGDELVVRVELRVDRDMEFVHLKDQRGSGTEPVNVLSRYRYQDGLGYYESTRDTASHFFIDYLPKGTYVFEYSTRVQLRGRYQTGVASIQCMYAPEFNSHSESVWLNVK